MINKFYKVGNIYYRLGEYANLAVTYKKSNIAVHDISLAIYLPSAEEFARVQQGILKNVITEISREEFESNLKIVSSILGL